MTCPFCGFRFRVLAVFDADELPSLAPIVCESCGGVALLEDRRVRKLEPHELTAVKQSPAWAEVIAPALEAIERAKKTRS